MDLPKTVERPEFGLSENGLKNGETQESAQTVNPRAYQLEMCEASLKRNVIVIMDTGSGKTYVAILRIRAELEGCPPGKFVWVVVPSVELAMQQHKSISTHLPAFQSMILSGADKCELWSKQWIWDEMLKGIRIVVCTHEILRAALVHGFMSMSQIALLVFDEAHHAVKSHPASKIMQFYHRAKIEDRPSILGLTASAVVNGETGGLSTLESNLNAISRTPKLNRDELLQYVHKPQLIKLIYQRRDPNTPRSQALHCLGRTIANLDIEQDPWVKNLRSEAGPHNRKALMTALVSQKTHSSNQMKGLYDGACYIASELGPWAADAYIDRCIRKLDSGATKISYLNTLDDTEKAYILKKLLEAHVPVADLDWNEHSSLSSKVRTLIDFLHAEESVDFSGLVFVQRRAEVAVLSHLLSVHPQTRKFLIGSFVGASTFSGRKFNIGDLADVKNQRDSVDLFRKGCKNLIISTNALEEGIDVSVCNVVVCFDKPTNLKSFIQRRGRARKSTSKYVVMFDDTADPEAMSKWQTLEDLMRQTYEDEMRQVAELKALEDGDEPGERTFQAASTGATLTLEDAVSHLYHFCDTLPRDPYVDPSPIFFYEHQSLNGGGRSISAKVVLPSSVDAAVREASSKAVWTKEKSARKDASFESYIALYHAGLIDDHLLPIGHCDAEVEAAYAKVEKRPNLVEVSEQIHVWPSVAEGWQTSKTMYASLVTVGRGDEIVMSMHMLLPIPLASGLEFAAYWDEASTFQVKIQPNVKTYPCTMRPLSARITSLLLRSVFKGRLTDGREDFTALFTPDDTTDLEAWLESYSGSDRADHLCDEESQDHFGLVRDMSNNGSPHVCHKVRYASVEDMQSCGMDAKGKGHRILHGGFRDLQSQNSYDGSMDVDDDSSQHSVFLEVTRLSKRADFLHPLTQMNESTGKTQGFQWLFANRCEVDRLPIKFARFALLIPSILAKLERSLVMEAMQKNLLSPLNGIDSGLVATSISASSAREPTNYQRLELLGDTVLKFSASLALMAKHLKYHEGILAQKKDHIVSNASLAQAAVQEKLDKYIITAPFTGHKWRPSYTADVSVRQVGKAREMSTKVLADVVEALIGAAYLDGAHEKALDCLALFLPRVHWLTAATAIDILAETYDHPITHIAHLKQIEQVINYAFGLKVLLLEAITHPSYRGPNESASYDRLEFLGDAVLDNIVTVAAFNHKPQLAVFYLHLIRSVLVNANFLGYLCLRLSCPIFRAETRVDECGGIMTVETSVPFYLWQAMRPAIHAAQNSCLERYSVVETLISEALQCGESCPWTALAYLEPPKFFSDIIESMIGAIYIDSHGSLDTCTAFLEHLGIMPYLRRLLEGKIALLHPKEELGQLSNQDSVTYEMGTEEEEGNRRLTCAIFLGQTEIVRVGNGISPMEVQTRAADEACKIVKQSQGSSISDNTKQGEGCVAYGLVSGYGRNTANEFPARDEHVWKEDDDEEDTYMTVDE